MKKQTLPLLLCLLPLLAFCQKSALRIFQKTFKTYMYSDPDPVPHPQSNIYPYFRFDGYTDEPVDKDWTIVELENEWIKVHITPEIGGKIWGAWEKSTGFPFVYANDVVKFRDVAMRGAWTSGGIEFNFGDIGHAPTVATPVDWTTRENPDGSVSCFVGALDLSSRTRWMVEINLPADKAYFTTRSRWYNCTPFETSYYHWMNGGFRAEGDLEFCFPGTNYIGHEGELHTWPIDEKGRDLSRYKNNDFGSYKSYHVLGEPTDWFGGYWHDDDMGVVHYSPYADKLGKKIWIWGLSRQGYIWEDLLTDKSGQYVELQSGRLFNQASPGSINSPFKHVAFKPYTTDEWTEYWYPVKGTGGIDAASKKGVFNVDIKGDSVRVRFVAVEKVKEPFYVSWQTFAGVKGHSSKQIKLAPMEIFDKTFPLKTTESDKIKIMIVSLGNETFTIIDEKKNKTDERLTADNNFDWESEYGLYLKGKDFMNQRRYFESLLFFEKCLSKNPNYLPALVECADVYQRMNDDRAEDYCKKALKINIYEPKANYIYGLVLDSKLSDNAINYYEIAALDPSFRNAVYLQMAKYYLRIGKTDEAYFYAKESYSYNSSNIEAINLLAFIERSKGMQEEALFRVVEALKKDPLNAVACYEKYMLTNDKADKEELMNRVTNELAHETFIELANWYADYQMLANGNELIKMSPDHPKVDEIKSYFDYYISDEPNTEKVTPDKSNNEIKLHFPYAYTKLEKRCNSSRFGNYGWKQSYHDAIMKWQQNQIKEAKTLFTSLANTPDYYPFYLAKADLFKDEPTVVLAALERAWALAPGDWRTAVRLANYHLENGNPAKALEYAEAGQKAHPKHSPMGLVYAKTLNANGLYEQCAAFLKNYKVLPAEGAYQAHDIWREANLHVALAKMTAKKWKDALPWLDAAMAWPENLGSGKPYFPDERLPMWMKSHCFKQLKRQGEAGVAKDFLFSYKNPDEAPGYLGEFLTALALRDDGKSVEAQQRLAAAPVGNTPDALQEWCRQTLEGQNPPEQTVELSRDWKVAMRFLEMLGK